jgi:hypothetical protein
MVFRQAAHMKICRDGVEMVRRCHEAFVFVVRRAAFKLLGALLLNGAAHAVELTLCFCGARFAPRYNHENRACHSV